MKKIAITVGCFDLLHEGHLNLFKKMKWIADEIVVGFHDDESIFKIKQVVTAQNYEERGLNISAIADEVFLIDNADPSEILRKLISDLRKREVDICYVRANDMPDFPGRQAIEDLNIPIFLIPYTKGISSTMLRAELGN